MAFPPTAFLIGAQKAATTYLASLLDKQHEIAVSHPKEPHFFTQHWAQGLDWYRQCFPDVTNCVLLDASPSYSVAPLHLRDAGRAESGDNPLVGVPDRIFSVSPNARFIYVIRDPIDQIWSSYWHEVRKGREDRDPVIAINENVRYWNISNYLGQIQLYLERFPYERFHFLRFEDVCNQPARTVESCLAFLGVSQSGTIQIESVGMHSGYRVGKFQRLVGKYIEEHHALSSIQSKLWNTLPEPLKDAVRRRLTRPIPPMPDEIRKQIAAHYLSMIHPLEELTGLNLEQWRARYLTTLEDDPSNITASASAKISGNQ